MTALDVDRTRMGGDGVSAADLLIEIPFLPDGCKDENSVKSVRNPTQIIIQEIFIMNIIEQRGRSSNQYSTERTVRSVMGVENACHSTAFPEVEPRRRRGGWARVPTDIGKSGRSRGLSTAVCCPAS
jgi:hypothetical protein